METYVKIQNDIEDKLIKAKSNFKKSPKTRLTESHIETRLQALEEQWNLFRKTHLKIIEIATAEIIASSSYFKNNCYESLEEFYIDFKSELKESLAKLIVMSKTSTILSSANPTIPISKNDNNIVKLPKITIPTFTGRYSEWPTFRDLFISLIHKNTTLDDVQKLHYLKGHITGEAEQLLRHVSITQANYNICWDLLDNRYNNKKYLSNCILRRLFSQRSLFQESSSGAKELLDTTTDSLNALQNLGVDISTWDIIIIYIVTSKLDTETRKQWELKVSDSSNELPTWIQFKDFLESRFRALECVESKFVKQKFNSSQSIQQSKTFHVTSPKPSESISTMSCPYCTKPHRLFNCKKFATENYENRYNFVQNNNVCFNCLGSNHPAKYCKQSTSCRICKRRHHSLLHSPKNVSNSIANSERQNQTIENISSDIRNSSVSSHGESSNVVSYFSMGQASEQVLLATALVKVVSGKGYGHVLRVLLDQGSQASFISESAVQLLGLKKMPNTSNISGLGENHGVLISKAMVQMEIESLHNPQFTIRVRAHVLKKITTLLPTKRVTVSNWPEINKLSLADPEYYIPNKIDLLLGADVYGQILVEGIIKGPPGTPIAQNTALGWILSGQIGINSTHRTEETLVSMHIKNDDDDNEILKKFWELESDQSIKPNKILSQEEQRCEEFFQLSTCRDSEGRYIVKLPFSSEDPACKYGKSKEIAITRFNQLERKLIRNPKLQKRYKEVIDEYISLGHIEEIIDKKEKDKKHAVYLPHHCVIREDKSTTKVRVVFDASCKGVNGISLNDNLMVGPTLQADLRHLIIRFRTYPICLVADIVKMYRQVKVAEEDTDYQRLIWRDNPKSEIKEFRHLRVTFGTASAPYLAVKTLRQLSQDEGVNYPLAAGRILDDFYMDDLMTGCQNEEELRKVYREINDLLKKGGFELQKWSSNNEELLMTLNEEIRNSENLEIRLDDTIKILGLTWNKNIDQFEYSIKELPQQNRITKRNVISEISRLFDPLGWISPIIIQAKIFIQKLWVSGIEWDELLPSHLLKEWQTYRENLMQLRECRIPRWYNTYEKDSKIELHGFSDASNLAYAAVVYVRNIDCEGKVHINLVYSRTKVAPIKTISIPRLELCGAVLLARLLVEVAEILKIPKSDIHAWTDSTVVLAWLKGLPTRWKVFVANRVSEILSLLDSNQWCHVQTSHNPADCASRGVKPRELLNNKLWFKGPHWLQNEIINYKGTEIVQTNLEEKPIKYFTVTLEEDKFCIYSMFSSLRKLARVIAYCRRFLRMKLPKTDRPEIASYLTSEEISKALKICIKQCQREAFNEDIEEIRRTKTVKKKSQIVSLNPYLDEEDILRVGGRLQRAHIDESAKHPILIPHKSHLTKLLITDSHEKTLHGGPQLMQNYLRNKYWIIKIKNLTKNYVRNCITCIKYNARFSSQLMGQLPQSRVTANRPFLHSGVDYAGPIQVRTSKGRGHHSYKGYICLFICMATKAIHLEIVSDMSTSAFLAAFKRFVARRGHCSDLWSDNGRNFVGAAKELKRLLLNEKSHVITEIAESLADNGTNWHFIPPYAPNFGGLWEAGVKSTKHHLKRVIGDSTLTYEEMATVLSQIEACLNSRPLSLLSSNPEDATPLTPGHFLIGEPLIIPPDRDYQSVTVGNLRRWQLTQRMVQSFWKRWSQEYLNIFLQRHKWAKQCPEPNVGNVVLIREEQLPPGKWLLGKIVQKYPGTDGLTRVVTLQCKGSLIKRPISRICLLPVSE